VDYPKRSVSIPRVKSVKSLLAGLLEVFPARLWEPLEQATEGRCSGWGFGDDYPQVRTWSDPEPSESFSGDAAVARKDQPCSAPEVLTRTSLLLRWLSVPAAASPSDPRGLPSGAPTKSSTPGGEAGPSGDRCGVPPGASCRDNPQLRRLE